jgi:hypothetical protein
LTAIDGACGLDASAELLLLVLANGWYGKKQRVLIVLHCTAHVVEGRRVPA